MKKDNFLIFFYIINLAFISFCVADYENTHDKNTIKHLSEEEKLSKKLQEAVEKETALKSSPFFEQMKKQFEMKQLLPKDCEEAISLVVGKIQNLFVIKNSGNFINDIIINLSFKLDELLISNKEKESEVNILVNLAFQLYRFIDIQQTGKMSEEEILIKLNNFLLSIDQVLINQSELLNLDSFSLVKNNLNIIYKTFNILKDILSCSKESPDVSNHIRNKCNEELSEISDKYCQDQREQIIKLIDNAKELIKNLKNNSDLKLELSEDKISEDKINEAIEYWLAFIDNEKNKLNYLLDDKTDMSKVLLGNFPESTTGKIFMNTAPIALGGYFLGRKFAELYNIDHKNNIGGWTNFFTDHTTRVIFSTVYFLHEFININKIKGNDQIKQFLLENLFFKLLDFYFDPNFCVKEYAWPLRALYRIAPAAGYHYYFKDSENLVKDENYRRAIWFSLKDGYNSAANIAEREIFNQIDSDVTNKIEDYSLGLIRPGITNFILDTAMPLVTYKNMPKNIADVTRDDVFATEVFKISNLYDWNYVGNRDYSKISDAQYIEGRVVGYCATSFGWFLGKKISAKTSNSIKSVFKHAYSLTLRGLYNLGVISNEENLDFLENFRSMLKIMIPASFVQENGTIKEPLLKYMLHYKILSQLEAAKLEEDIKNLKEDQNKKIISETELEQKKEEILDLVGEKILSMIEDNIVIALGGWVGSFAAWAIANSIMNNYGPFYPKIKNSVTS